jgi:Tol biopolymer transport system component
MRSPKSIFPKISGLWILLAFLPAAWLLAGHPYPRLLLAAGGPSAVEHEKTPADSLPPHIQRLTWFGERADWSHDGTKILFVGKTYGDVYEAELKTGIIRAVTHHFYHGGFTRALYLANGDILLSGATSFDSAQPHLNRTEKAELWVLDKSLTKPPVRLGTKCSEGPAVSRKQMHIAWTHVNAQYPEQLPKGSSRIYEADIEYLDGIPRLKNQRLVLDSQSLPFQCTLETQNFRPPFEKELTFSAYGYQETEVCGVNLETGKVVNYSNAPGQYDEPEGIFPDGKHTLVECDRQNRKGSGYIDIWKLKLDGSGSLARLTSFSDTPGHKASNPVISDDGRFMAFQLAKSKDPAGVGYGIFIYDFAKAGQIPRTKKPEKPLQK